jgi:hypothetical protein
MCVYFFSKIDVLCLILVNPVTIRKGFAQNAPAQGMADKHAYNFHAFD